MKQKKQTSTSNCAQEFPWKETVNTSVNWFQWTVKARNRRRRVTSSATVQKQEINDKF